MNLPLELKKQLSHLPADEATEIETFIANLPQDFEIQTLLEESLDALMAVLTTKEPVHS
jgi:RNAse (barnase) inhibitor barstar